MLRTILIPLTVSCAFWGALGLLVCRAAPQDAASSAEASSPDAIAKWIQRLDSNRFAERSEASRHLERIGKAACPALAEAAVGGSREAMLRAIDILRTHFQQGDEATKQAAKEALEKIAKSGREPAARRAQEVLTPPPPANAPGLPRIAIGPQIQIQLNAGGRQIRRVRIAGGVKQIDVEDNGRKVKITEDANGGIQMAVTEKKNGKPTTKKYTAKNEAQLKKNHPEAHKLYEKYAKQAGGRIQVRAVPLQPGVVPRAPMLPGQIQQRMPRRSAALHLKQARRLVELAVKQLRQMKETGKSAEELKRTIKQLEEIAQQLEQQQAKLNEGG